MQQVSALEMEWGKTADIDQSNEKELSLFYIVLFFVRFHLNTLFYIATQKKEENNKYLSLSRRKKSL